MVGANNWMEPQLSNVSQSGGVPVHENSALVSKMGGGFLPRAQTMFQNCGLTLSLAMGLHLWDDQIRNKKSAHPTYTKSQLHREGRVV